MLLRGARSKHDMHNWSCYTSLAASASLVWAFLCFCFLVLDCPSQLLQYHLLPEAAVLDWFSQLSYLSEKIILQITNNVTSNDSCKQVSTQAEE